MNTTRSLAATSALCLVSVGAQAQGWIVGGAVGQAMQDDYDIGGPVSMRDDTDDSYRIFGGYLVSPNQGVVVSYIDLGTTYYDGPAYGNFTDYFEAEGFDISYIVGFAPGAQQRVSLFGTLGLFAWDQDESYTELVGTSPTRYEYADSGTSFSVGLGTDINFDSGGTSAWSIHVEWQLFKDVGNSGQEYDREVFSVGASYRFGRN